MITAEEAKRHLNETFLESCLKNYTYWNPEGKSLENLKVIIGFSNGGMQGWMQGVLISEDGEVLGTHISHDEQHMLADLGIVRGSAPHRHVVFRERYPGGYRMHFVPMDQHLTDPALQYAFLLNKTAAEAEMLERMGVRKS